MSRTHFCSVCVRTATEKNVWVGVRVLSLWFHELAYGTERDLGKAQLELKLIDLKIFCVCVCVCGGGGGGGGGWLRGAVCL